MTCKFCGQTKRATKYNPCCRREANHDYYMRTKLRRMRDQKCSKWSDEMVERFNRALKIPMEV